MTTRALTALILLTVACGACAPARPPASERVHAFYLDGIDTLIVRVDELAVAVRAPRADTTSWRKGSR